MERIDQLEPAESEYRPKPLLTTGQILTLIQREFVECNSFYGGYSVRIAYIAYMIAQNLPESDGIDVRDLVVLSLFRNVSDYHFEVERQRDYDVLTANDIRQRYVYAYAWVKNLTPLTDLAQCYLYYDTAYNPILASKIKAIEYGSIIFIAERIVKMLLDNGFKYEDSDFNKYGFNLYNQKYIEIFKKADSEGTITRMLKPEKNKSGKEVIPCIKEMEKIYNTFKFTPEQDFQYFKTLIIIIDFKSTVTVWHTIHTAGYACSIGRLLGLTDFDVNQLFTAGVLHDIGKIGIPQTILEFPGKLKPWEYKIIQNHVKKTEELIEDVVESTIAKMAFRHHEKLNGKGYPYGLKADELTRKERIVMVADVLSALADRRSYKGEMNEEELMEILQDCAAKNELDSSIIEVVKKSFKLIQENRDVYSNLLALPLGLVEMDFQEEISLEDGI